MTDPADVVDDFMALLSASVYGIDAEVQAVAPLILMDDQRVSAAFGFAIAMLTQEARRDVDGPEAWLARQRAIFDQVPGA